nr:MAG TPA: hypothetical protein [Caudoviricetes sp.]
MISSAIFILLLFPQRHSPLRITKKSQTTRFRVMFGSNCHFFCLD